MTYNHLTFEKRCVIAALWKAGYSQNYIAKEVNEGWPGFWIIQPKVL